MPSATAVIAKAARGGRGARGLYNYISDKAGAQLLDSNMAGSRPAEWAREVSIYRAAAPNCTRVMDHWSIALDPRQGRLSDDQWRALAGHWMQCMEYRDRAFVLVRHTDTNVDHVHLAICRIDLQGQVHKDSNAWRRSHVAAARAAEAIGLKPLSPRPPEQAAPTDKATRAQHRNERRRKRAAQRGEPTPAALDARAIADVLRAATARAASADELVDACRAAGVELEVVRKSCGQVQGLRARPAGGDGTWLKASELTSARDLSWSRIAPQLAANAEQRQHAPPSLPTPTQEPKEPSAMMSTSTPTPTPNDPLSFLSQPQPPTPHQSRGGTDVARTQQRERDAQEAGAQLQAELRRLSSRQLYAIESRARDLPPLAASDLEVWHQLLRLVILVLTVGVVDIGHGQSQEGQQRTAALKLAELARDELARRRAEPAAPAARLQMLRQHQTELLEHRAAIAAWQPRQADDVAWARAQADARTAYYQRQRAQGQPGFDDLREEITNAELAVEATARAGWLSGRPANTQDDAAAARRLAEARRRLAEAEEQARRSAPRKGDVLRVAAERRRRLADEIDRIDRQLAQLASLRDEQEEIEAADDGGGAKARALTAFDRLDRLDRYRLDELYREEHAARQLVGYALRGGVLNDAGHTPRPRRAGDITATGQRLAEARQRVLAAHDAVDGGQRCTPQKAAAARAAAERRQQLAEDVDRLRTKAQAQHIDQRERDALNNALSEIERIDRQLSATYEAELEPCVDLHARDERERHQIDGDDDDTSAPTRERQRG